MKTKITSTLELLLYGGIWLSLGMVVALGLAATPAHAQTLYASSDQFVYKVTSTGKTVYATLPDTSFAAGLAVDRAGNLYVAVFGTDNGVSSINKVTPDGTMTLYSTLPPPVDTEGLGLAIDSSGVLYVTDDFFSLDDFIYRISTSGIASEFEGPSGGNPQTGPLAGGQPICLAFDRKGFLYTANNANHSVCKISPSGDVKVLANLSATSHPYGVACDHKNNVYVSDIAANNILKITPSGRVSVFIQLGPNAQPQGLVFDLSGNLYVVGNTVISKISPDGRQVSPFASGLGPVNNFLALASDPALPSTLVAAKGDEIGDQPGDAVLSSAGPAAIDAAGDVAFHFIATGANARAGSGSGIVFYPGGTAPQILAQTGPDAGHPAAPPFTKLSDPVLSGQGALAFVGTMKAGGSGVFVSQNGTTSLGLSTGDAAPGLSGATFQSFMNIGINIAGGVAVLAKVSPAANSPALFASDQSGVLQLIAHKGEMFSVPSGTVPVTGITAFQPLAEVGGQSRTLDEVSGNVVALVKGARGKRAVRTALSGTGGFTLNTSLATGSTDAALFGSDTIKSIGEPALKGTGFTLSVVLAGAGVKAANKLEIISMEGFIREGDFAPDASGAPTTSVFAKLSDPVLNSDHHIAFVGTLKTGGANGVTAKNAAGIWADVDGTLKQVVRAGDPAPGTGGTFAAFKQIVLPNVHGVAFEATLRGGSAAENQGLWAVTPDGLEPAVIAGQELDLHGVSKTVKKIGVFQQASSVLGQSRSFEASTGNLVYEATFTDGSWGIYEVVFP